MKRPVAHALLIAAFVAAAFPQSEPGWKNTAESDIGLAAGNEKDPGKKLELLKKWEQQYPDSALKDQRTFMTTQALTALITASFGKQDGPAIDAGTKAAHQLIDGLGTYFNDALLKLPQLDKMQPEAWAKARSTSEMQAHALLGWSAALKKDDAAAESEYRKVLTIDPTQAESSYRLGAILLHEIAGTQNFARVPEALYELARSLAVTGPGALPPEGKTVAGNALKTNYNRYHGSTEGLEELIREAANSPFPPPDFHILSIVEIDQAKQRDHDAWAKDHPDLAFWETIRTALQMQGDTFFSTLQGVAFPPEATDAYKGPAMFRGTVISMPAPRQILVNVDNVSGDAILKFDDAIRGEIPAGTAIQFKGVVDAYTKDPYTLTIAIAEPKAEIIGLSDGVKFGPAPKTPARPAARPGAKGRGKAR
jgi:hypothetical protein